MDLGPKGQKAVEPDGIDLAVADAGAPAVGAEEGRWRCSFEADMMGCAPLVEAAMPARAASPAGSVDGAPTRGVRS